VSAVLELAAPARRAFCTELTVAWAAIDANAHLRSTAYLDAVNDCRMQFFHVHGWPLARFQAERIGPVLLDEHITYSRELRLGDRAVVELTLAGLRHSGAAFRFRNVVRRTDDGAVAATVTSDGAWMDLDRRRLVTPPPAVVALLDTLARHDDDT
jgi:acyl-CoA thioester hydrolase